MLTEILYLSSDPANDDLHYKAAVDVSELITVDDAMQHMHLGPNGALVFALEYLLQNIDWFTEKLSKFRDHYVIIDCPGQVQITVTLLSASPKILK